ncbi:MAG TPA: BolA family transcriptional regulator [Polyangiaceae bacterium LLY-WYZ-15_(1-7)]|nr:BolA family transcriptional regulator [Sandaracinus sp.]HJK91097.1 BolA family transcriptional regulator [Polyangiaceae bacterium LLY-WYZ-15_(1-7)]MBJ74755.1 BolA family transcriptional regulator [Sandaracinus sp.]HJL04284.1 BolA family transcriptional regulator [Polyangiaceae bacterium LLY-WYZ-15_(1-7)]HJL10503.1 BolA family transcriptional regulator [Polyangiaceae bacterium LLY-WYZ-15_(1-7)]
MVEPSVIEERIREGVGGVSHLEVKDLTGTKDHYEAVIVSEAFEGKSRVDQQRMVFSALGELMDGPIHALTFKTYTPERWAKIGGGA